MLDQLIMNGSIDLFSLISASAVLAAVSMIAYYLNGPRKLDLPVVGKQTDHDFREALLEGNKLYPSTPWILPTPMHPTVVLPGHMINEIKNLPESTISLRLHHYTIFSGRYTKFGEETPELYDAIRIDLTRAADKQLEAFQDEVGYAYKEYVGDCKDWTPVPLYQSMLNVISLLSGRVFVGLPVSREKDWVETTSQYTIEGAMGAHALTPYPTWLRPLMAPFIMKSVKMHRARARRIMQSVLDQFTTEDGMNSRSGGDLIGWILPRYKGQITAERLARDQLIATFVAIHTTTICLVGALFDLAARPEYIDPLREELNEVLALDPERKLNKTTIHKLSKMDSFVKESQRLNPPGLVTMLRVVTDPNGLKLSTGHTIPQGYTTSVNNHAINMEIGGTEFDGMRFHKMRQQPGHETKHQLVTTGTDSIAFGHGDHSCPGRFFAGNEIKVIMAHLLLNYDIKTPDGLRPENNHRGATVSPPRTAILFKAMSQV